MPSALPVRGVTARELLVVIVLFALVAVAFAPDAADGSGVFWYHDLRHHHYLGR